MFNVKKKTKQNKTKQKDCLMFVCPISLQTIHPPEHRALSFICSTLGTSYSAWHPVVLKRITCYINETGILKIYSSRFFVFSMSSHFAVWKDDTSLHLSCFQWSPQPFQFKERLLILVVDIYVCFDFLSCSTCFQNISGLDGVIDNILIEYTYA